MQLPFHSRAITCTLERHVPLSTGQEFDETETDSSFTRMCHC